MAITYALMQRLEELSEQEPDRVQIVKKARVTNVNKEGNLITGVTYELNGESQVADGVVVLATGGYAADFGNKSLLQEHRPDTFGLSSTNGTHATGDGQKMLMEIGANGIDMDKVQVHPTGLVDPKDPGAKFKFLAAEALRGEGGLLLNSDGDRSPTSWVTVTTSRARCGRRRRRANGPSVSSLTARPPTSWTSTPVTTLAVV